MSATITGRPTIYYENVATDPLRVPAGASVSINLNGMTISGAQVWLWISKSGGAVIEPGDKFLVGPFYLGDVFDSVPHIYVFRPGVNLPSPWSAEGRDYVYSVGYGWINGTMPLMVEGGEYYWLKITDVDPRLGTSIPPSDVSVSNNRIVFTPVFTATPADGSTLAPSTPITIKGYALPLNEKYNITQDSTEVYTLLSPEKKTVDDWSYTVLEVPSFPLLDLELRYPDSDGTVSVNVVANSTGSTVATFTYTEPARVVYLDTHGPLNHEGDYFGVVVLETGESYNVTLNWFPYMGSVSIYLNTTLLASGVPLNATGGIENYAVKIPNVPSGKYVFKIIDNNSVEYNFTVSVVMVPYIEVEPTEGYVGDTITVHGYNFLDYVGKYVTIYFETCGGNYELLANFTVPSSEWSYDITVPVAPGGVRVVEVRDSTGTSVIADATFTILPKINIVPSSVASNYTGLIKVLGLGLEPYYGYWITVDNTFAGVSYCGDCGNFTAILLGGGFRPGLHVVAVYDWDLGLLLAYKHFIVTEEGDIIAGKLDAINALLLEIRDGVAVIKTDVGEIKIKLDAVNASISGLIVDSKGEVLAKIDTATGTILAKLDAINAVITSIQGDVATIKTDVGTIKANVGTIKSIVENNNALLLEIKDGVAVIKTDVGTIKADVAAIKPVITSIQGDVATIKTDVGTIKTDVAAIKPVVTEIKDGVATIKTDLGDLKGVVTTINGNVATIMTDVGTIKADVSTVKSGVEDVKSGISGVRGDVSGVMYAVIAAVILSLIAAVAAIYSVMSIRKALVH